jgi:hypothetical protein
MESHTVALPIALSHDLVEAFCQRNQIIWMALFGSVLRPDFDAASDVDVLVKFAPDSQVGLIGLSRMAQELSQLIGREVDLLTPGFLSPYFRDDVLPKAQVIYAEAA